jgi:hypothetical protein
VDFVSDITRENMNLQFAVTLLRRGIVEFICWRYDI